MKNKLIEKYLEIKGRHHTNLNEFWAELMNETNGNIPEILMKEGIKDITYLERFLLPNQLPKIRAEIEKMIKTN